MKGASDGRGREHEFGGDADVHAGYDSSDAGVSLSSDTGTSGSDGITSSGVLESAESGRAQRCSTRPMAGRRGQSNWCGRRVER